MRWYCVHPSLPPQAELRVRSAPDSDAPERARLSRGRAVAACAPAFIAPGDDALSWLQVAYTDEATQETQAGFMMAALPDGTALLAPWEDTECVGCAELEQEAPLYDGPDQMQSVAKLRVGFALCVLEEQGDRARVYHAEMESAWVDKELLHTVCSRLRHKGCNTSHSFYRLNDALPDEAQIAIREFPSKEAQTVDLLSRGETLEATVRGGNWLRIVTGDEEQGEAWIMWRTDALELLTDIPELRASSCELAQESPVASGDDTSAQELLATDNIESQDEMDDNPSNEVVETVEKEPSWDDRPVRQAATVEDEVDASLSNEIVESTHLESSWDDRPIQPAASVEADIDLKPAKEVVEPTQAEPSGDDRPIRPAATVEAAIDVNPADEVVEPRQAEPSWDDRPIRPASTPTDNCDADPSDEPAETESSWDDRPIQPAATVEADIDLNPAEEIVEPTQAEPSWDDRPIRPAATVEAAIDVNPAEEIVEPRQAEPSWDDRPIRPASTPVDDIQNAEPMQAALSWDDRPIRPAPTVEDDIGDNPSDEIAEQADADPTWDDRPIRPAATLDGSDVHLSDEVVEPVRTVLSWDDRPIRPAPKAEVETGASPSNDIVEPSPAELAKPSWDDQPIRPAPTLADDGNAETSNEVVESKPVELPPDNCKGGTDVNDELSAPVVEEPDCAVKPDESTPDVLPVRIAPSLEEQPIQQRSTDAAADASERDINAQVVESVQAALSLGVPPTRPSVTSLSDTSDSEVDVPMLGESAPSWEDDCLIQPLNDAADYVVDLPMLGDGAKSAQASPSWDERPPQPVTDIDDSFMLDKPADATPSKDNELVTELEKALASPCDDNDGSGRFHKAAANASVLVAETSTGSNAWDDIPVGPRQRLKKEDSAAWGDAPIDNDDRSDDSPLANDPSGKLRSYVNGSEAMEGDTVDDRVRDNQSPDDVAGDLSDSSDIADNKDVDAHDPDAAAYLQKFGVEKYCEHKQTLVAPSDELSQAVYEATQDDSDLLFQALVGDDPLSDSWFQDVSSRDISTEPEEDAERLVDILYSRNESASPSAVPVKSPARPLTASSVPKPSEAGPVTTYDIIMGADKPEDILEAGLSEEDDQEDFDLMSNFQYPVPKRRVIDGRSDRASSLFKRVPSAPTGMSLVETEVAGTENGPTLRVQSPSPLQQRTSVSAKTSPVSSGIQGKRSSAVGQGLTPGSSIARHPSPLRQRMSESAITSPALKKSITPPKSSVPTQSVGAPTIPTPATSRLTQRRSIATPSSIGKPPTSLARPRSRTAVTSEAAPVVKPRASSLARPAAVSSIPARTTSDPSPPKPTRSLLQRRSLLPTPSPSKAPGASTTRNSLTSSIPKPPEASGLQAPRKSFGFRRPSALTKN